MKKFYRLISFILVLSIMISSIPAIAAPETKPLETVKTTAIGNEASTEVIEIDSAKELQLIGTDANYPLNGNYILVSDINMEAKEENGGLGEGALFKPIGDESNPFTGTFDGMDSNGTCHVISHLNVDTTSYENKNNAGLFGCVSGGGTIKNVGIEAGSIKGGNNVGGIVGSFAEGTLENCYYLGNVSGAECVGGIVGASGGKKTDSTSGEVSITVSTMKNCYQIGNIEGTKNVGGLVGQVYSVSGKTAKIENCYHTGKVKCTDISAKVNDSLGNYMYFGGIIGSYYSEGGLGNYYFEDCYYNKQHSGNATLTIGAATDGNSEIVDFELDDDDFSNAIGKKLSVKGLNTDEMIGPYALAHMTGFIETIYAKNSSFYVAPTLSTYGGVNYYPQLRSFVPVGRENDLAQFPIEDMSDDDENPTPDKPDLGVIEINNEAELQKIGKDANYPLDGDYMLVSDLNMEGIDFKPIGEEGKPFTGTFNGMDSAGTCHVISNLTIDTTAKKDRNSVSLFGVVSEGGVIKNLGVENGTVSSVGNNVGGIVGWIAQGTVENCYYIGNVSGAECVGGVVGSSGQVGSFSGIATVKNCYHIGSVEGDNNVGGIVGKTCSVYGVYTTVENCYHTGEIISVNNFGGLIGCYYNDGGVGSFSFASSYYNSEDSGNVTKAIGYITDGEKEIVDFELGDTDFSSDLGKKINFKSLTRDKMTGSNALDNMIGMVDSDGNNTYVAPPEGAGEVGYSYYPQLTVFVLDKTNKHEFPSVYYEEDDVPEESVPISSAEDLKKIGNIEGYSLDRSYNLTGNIDMSGVEFNSIGSEKSPFIGTLDGQGYKITGYSGSNGLFKNIGEGGTVKNLGIEGHIVANGEDDNIGGIVGGISKGTIENCYFEGGITGGNYVGGIAGYAEAANILTSYHIGTIIANKYAGGLVGKLVSSNEAKSKVNRCYHSGYINGKDVSKCGGLIAYLDGSFEQAELGNCYYDKENSGIACYAIGGDSSGIFKQGYDNEDARFMGLTTAQMTGPDIFNAAIATADNFETERAYIAAPQQIDDDGNYYYPQLSVFVSDSLTGDEYLAQFPRDLCENAIGIYSESDLLKIGQDDLYPLSANYTLLADMNMKQITDFKPIGTKKAPFTGILNGNGHVISNLKIEYGDKQDYVGLFGYIGKGGTVKKLGVKGSVNGGKYVGGVAGYISEGASVENCYFNGEVAGKTVVGGIVGCNDSSKVINCYQIGSILGTESVGGIVGEVISKDSAVTLKKPKANDNVIATVQGCYHTGRISCDDVSKCGGIIGAYKGTAEECLFKDCYYDNKASGNANSNGDAGNAIGFAEGSVVHGDYDDWNFKGLSHEQMTGPDAANNMIGLIDGTENSPYIAPSEQFDGLYYYYPQLSLFVQDPTNISEFPKSYASILDNMIPVYSAVDLKKIGNKDYPTYSLDSEYILMNDINMNLVSDFKPIGYEANRSFSGVFNGNGHEIYNLNLNIEGGNKVGLFSSVKNGTIINLGVSGAVTGANSVGGLAGQIYNGSIIENCYFVGGVYGEDTVGGLVGQSGAKNEGSAKILNSYHIGNIIANDQIGGVAGTVIAEKTEVCYPTIQNCYHTGYIRVKGDNCGGIVGLYDVTAGDKVEPAFKNSYYNKDNSGDVTRPFGADLKYLTQSTNECKGLSTEEMTGPEALTFMTGMYNDKLQRYAYIAPPQQKDGSGDYYYPQLSIFVDDSLEGDRYLEQFPKDHSQNGISIYSASDLRKIGSDPKYDLDYNYVLANDIDLKDENFTPIGDDSDPFTGNFNGNGHTIYGLNVNIGDYAGLFGCVEDGKVKNVKVEGLVVGKTYVGGIVGWLARDSYIENCAFIGNVYGAQEVGGIAGRQGDLGTKYGAKGGNSFIRNCYHVGGVVGTENVGGISGKVVNAYYDGKEGKDPEIGNCYHTGAIYADKAYGGLIGYFHNSKITENNNDKTDCNLYYSFYDNKNCGNVGPNQAIGECYGNNKHSHYTDATVGDHPEWHFMGLRTDEMTGPNAFCIKPQDNTQPEDQDKVIPSRASLDDSTSEENTTNDTTEYIDMKQMGYIAAHEQTGIYKSGNTVYNIYYYPQLSVFINDEKTIDEYDALSDDDKKAYLSQFPSDPANNQLCIYTATQLKAVGYSDITLGADYILMNDITLDENEKFEPIGNYNYIDENGLSCKPQPFTGTFDGNGHTIYGLNVQTEDYAGLFGCVENGIVKNIKVDGLVVGKNYVGGIVGWLARNSHIENCAFIGNITGEYEVGGIAGRQGDLGIKYGATGGNAFIRNCYHVGGVVGKENVGGISGKVVNAYYDGKEGKDPEIGNCYHTGAIQYDTNGGGLIGYFYNSKITENNNDKTDCNLYYSFYDNKNCGNVGPNQAIGECYGNNKHSHYTDATAGDHPEWHFMGLSTDEMTGPNAFCIKPQDDAKAEEQDKVTPDVPTEAIPDDSTSDDKAIDDTTEYIDMKQMGYIAAPEQTGIDESGNKIYYYPQLNVFINDEKTLDEYNVLSDDDKKAYLSQFPSDPANNQLCIYTAAQLKAINYSSRTLDTDYILMRDITLDENEKFEPIGSEETPFTGTFDGNGYTISGLWVETGDYAGLFGAVDDHGMVSGIRVVGSVFGGNNTGGVVGWLGNDAEIKKCCFIGNVYGNDATGGVVGLSGDAGASKKAGNARIIGCYQIGGIVGADDVGGVVGKVFNSNYDGYGKPKVVGCYHSGYIHHNGRYHGGLIGYYKNPEISENDGKKSDCEFRYSYYDNQNSNMKKAIGGTYGFGDGSNAYTDAKQGDMEEERFMGLSTEQMTGPIALDSMTGMVDENGNSLYVAAPAQQNQIDGGAASEDITDQSEKLIDDDAKEELKEDDGVATDTVYHYPQLSIFVDKKVPEENNGLLTASVNYSISEFPVNTSKKAIPVHNTRELQAIGYSEGTLAATYVLMNDIDMTGVDFTPIGGTDEKNFKGRFNGNSFVISNLNIDTDSDYVGLFACAGSGAIIKDVGVTGNIKGDSYVGGIVGWQSDGSVLSNCFYVGDVSGKEQVGGLVGQSGVDPGKAAAIKWSVAIGFLALESLDILLALTGVYTVIGIALKQVFGNAWKFIKGIFPEYETHKLTKERIKEIQAKKSILEGTLLDNKDVDLEDIKEILGDIVDSHKSKRHIDKDKDQELATEDNDITIDDGVNTENHPNDNSENPLNNNKIDQNDNTENQPNDNNDDISSDSSEDSDSTESETEELIEEENEAAEELQEEIEVIVKDAATEALEETFDKQKLKFRGALLDLGFDDEDIDAMDLNKLMVAIQTGTIKDELTLGYYRKMAKKMLKERNKAIEDGVIKGEILSDEKIETILELINTPEGYKNFLAKNKHEAFDINNWDKVIKNQDKMTISDWLTNLYRYAIMPKDIQQETIEEVFKILEKDVWNAFEEVENLGEDEAKKLVKDAIEATAKARVNRQVMQKTQTNSIKEAKQLAKNKAKREFVEEVTKARLEDNDYIEFEAIKGNYKTKRDNIIRQTATDLWNGNTNTINAQINYFDELIVRNNAEIERLDGEIGQLPANSDGRYALIQQRNRLQQDNEKLENAKNKLTQMKTDLVKMWNELSNDEKTKQINAIIQTVEKTLEGEKVDGDVETTITVKQFIIEEKEKIVDAIIDDKDIDIDDNDLIGEIIEDYLNSEDIQAGLDEAVAAARAAEHTRLYDAPEAQAEIKAIGQQAIDELMENAEDRLDIDEGEKKRVAKEAMENAIQEKLDAAEAQAAKEFLDGKANEFIASDEFKQQFQIKIQAQINQNVQARFETEGAEYVNLVIRKTALNKMIEKTKTKIALNLNLRGQSVNQSKNFSDIAYKTIKQRRGEELAKIEKLVERQLYYEMWDSIEKNGTIATQIKTNIDNLGQYIFRALFNTDDDMVEIGVFENIVKNELISVIINDADDVEDIISKSIVKNVSGQSDEYSKNTIYLNAMGQKVGKNLADIYRQNPDKPDAGIANYIKTIEDPKIKAAVEQTVKDIKHKGSKILDADLGNMQQIYNKVNRDKNTKQIKGTRNNHTGKYEGGYTDEQLIKTYARNQHPTQTNLHKQDTDEYKIIESANEQALKKQTEYIQKHSRTYIDESRKVLVDRDVDDYMRTTYPALKDGTANNLQQEKMLMNEYTKKYADYIYNENTKKSEFIVKIDQLKQDDPKGAEIYENWDSKKAESYIFVNNQLVSNGYKYNSLYKDDVKYIYDKVAEAKKNEFLNGNKYVVTKYSFKDDDERNGVQESLINDLCKKDKADDYNSILTNTKKQLDGTGYEAEFNDAVKVGVKQFWEDYKKVAPEDAKAVRQAPENLQDMFVQQATRRVMTLWVNKDAEGRKKIVKNLSMQDLNDRGYNDLDNACKQDTGIVIYPAYDVLKKIINSKGKDLTDDESKIYNKLNKNTIESLKQFFNQTDEILRYPKEVNKYILRNKVYDPLLKKNLITQEQYNKLVNLEVINFQLIEKIIGPKQMNTIKEQYKISVWNKFVQKQATARYFQEHIDEIMKRKDIKDILDTAKDNYLKTNYGKDITTEENRLKNIAQQERDKYNADQQYLTETYDSAVTDQMNTITNSLQKKVVKKYVVKEYVRNLPENDREQVELNALKNKMKQNSSDESQSSQSSGSSSSSSSSSQNNNSQNESQNGISDEQAKQQLNGMSEKEKDEMVNTYVEDKLDEMINNPESIISKQVANTTNSLSEVLADDLDGAGFKTSFKDKFKDKMVTFINKKLEDKFGLSLDLLATTIPLAAFTLSSIIPKKVYWLWFGSSSISNCYHIGAVSGKDDVGGLVGYVRSSENVTYKMRVENSYNSGSVKCGTRGDCGGLVGYYNGKANHVVFENSYYDYDNSGDAGLYNAIGSNSDYMLVDIDSFKGMSMDQMTGANALNEGNMALNVTTDKDGNSVSTQYFTAPIAQTDEEGYYYYPQLTTFVKDKNSMNQFPSSQGCGSTISFIPISTPEQLMEIDDTEAGLSGNYMLMNDITFTEEDNFESIGCNYTKTYNTDNGFKGTFKGNGHTIDIGDVDGKSNSLYLGLFSQISGGKVFDLNVKGNVEGAYCTGILAGRVINDSTIDGCSVEGNVKLGSRTGGITGELSDKSQMRYCSHIGVVEAGDESGGGLIGNMTLKSNASSNNGTPTLKGCYNAGPIYTDDASTSGALVGRFDGYFDDGAFANNYYDYENIGDLRYNKAIGNKGDCEGLYGLSTEEMTGSNALENMEGVNSKYIAPPVSSVDEKVCYPQLKTAVSNSENAEEFPSIKHAGQTNVIEIDSAEELLNIGKSAVYPLNGKYVLTCDIDFTGRTIEPIGTFTGSFDGQGHTISNVYINTGSSSFWTDVGDFFGADNSNDYIGFFSRIEDTGCVINTKWNNIAAKGDQYVGLVTGYMENGARLENCQVKGDSRIEADDDVGGLTGELIGESTIKTCSVECEIEADERIGGAIGYATDSFVLDTNHEGFSIGHNDVGGMVGKFKIRNEVTSRLKGCYSSGYTGANESQNTGALVGYMRDEGFFQKHDISDTDFSGSYYNKDNYGNSDGGAIGTDSGFDGDNNGGDKKGYKFKGLDVEKMSGQRALGVLGMSELSTDFIAAPVQSSAIESKTLKAEVVGSEIVETEVVEEEPVQTNDEEIYYLPQHQEFVSDPTNRDDFIKTSGQNVLEFIETTEDLQRIASSTDRLGADYILMNDLDLTNCDFVPIGNSGETYSAFYDSIDIVGGDFSGTFDGNGHTIKVNVNRSDEDNVGGVFGCVGSGGTLKNLRVEGNVTGEDTVGGIVGWLSDDATIENCCFVGNVYGDENVGGIAGYQGDLGPKGGNSDIINCYHVGNIFGREDVGGIAGEVAIQYHSADGGVFYENSGIGIIDKYHMGYDYPEMINCYHTGYISAKKDCGGLIGYVSIDFGYTEHYTFKNSYYDKNNSGMANKAIGGAECHGTANSSNMIGYVGGLKKDGGDLTKTNFKGLTTEEMTGLNALNNMVGFNEEIEVTDAEGNTRTTKNLYVASSEQTATDENGNMLHYYPQLSLFVTDESDLTQFPSCLGGNKIGISTADELQAVEINEGTLGADYILMNDITMSDNNFNPIGTEGNPFTGKFYGEGHVISNLKVDVGDNSDYAGLFAHIQNGMVKDLGVDGYVKGADYVGGLVAWLGKNATVENCYFTGEVYGYDKDTGAFDDGDSENVGGLVGYSGDKGVFGGSADIINCYTVCKVTGTEDVGGIVGQVVNNGKPKVKGCYHTGEIKCDGNDNCGGIIGYYGGSFKSDYFDSCYYDNQNSGDANTNKKGKDNAIGMDSKCITKKGNPKDYDNTRFRGKTTAEMTGIHATTNMLNIGHKDENGIITDAYLSSLDQTRYPQLAVFVEDKNDPNEYPTIDMAG